MPTLRPGISSCFILAALVAFKSMAWGADSTISCKSPPKESASVAVHPGTEVSTTQDHQKDTCTFSINGAVATSPPAQEVLNALNTFRDPSRRFLFESEREVSALAALMAAAAPVNEVPIELVQTLNKVAEPLKRCLGKFFADKGIPDERVDPIRFWCRGLNPYNPDTKARSLEETGIAAGVATLAVSLRWGSDRFTSTVYLPLTMSGLPALPLQ